MGRINKEIPGGFSVKAGTVVEAHWRGIAIMCSLPKLVILCLVPRRPRSAKSPDFAELGLLNNRVLVVLIYGNKRDACTSMR